MEVVELVDKGGVGRVAGTETTGSIVTSSNLRSSIEVKSKNVTGFFHGVGTVFETGAANNLSAFFRLFLPALALSVIVVKHPIAPLHCCMVSPIF